MEMSLGDNQATQDKIYMAKRLFIDFYHVQCFLLNFYIFFFWARNIFFSCRHLISPISPFLLTVISRLNQTKREQEALASCKKKKIRDEIVFMNISKSLSNRHQQRNLKNRIKNKIWGREKFFFVITSCHEFNLISYFFFSPLFFLFWQKVYWFMRKFQGEKILYFFLIFIKKKQNCFSMSFYLKLFHHSS